MKVPFADVGIAGKPYEVDTVSAALRVLNSGHYIGGPEVEAFEREFAEFCGASDAVAVKNGTAALVYALRAAGVRPGDEVVTVAMTFIATAEAISLVGARPVFVDVDPRTGLMDVASVEAVVTPRTRAIIPVHLYGQPVEMDPLLALAEQHGLAVIEDACQAHGAEYRGRRTGALGHFAAFSFYPSKNLGACGEGGLVTVRRPSAADLIRRLRDHGQSRRYHHEIIGDNGRLDAVQAAMLRVKLRWLDAANAQRRKNALFYEQALADAVGVQLPWHPAHVLPVYHLYVVQVEDRDRVRQRLAGAGIDTGLHYPVPVHLQPAFRELGHRRGDLPNTERLAARALSLPFFPDMTETQIAYVAERLKEAIA
jgi:dTDP-4-amino-4,6-dideoxygalactose transaminase